MCKEINLLETIKILNKVKDIVKESIEEIKTYNINNLTQYSFSHENRREMKAKVDIVINKIIIDKLKGFNIPILSEESGAFVKRKKSNYKFIIDPLDGTVNFVRGTGPSAISIALYKGNSPVFGVIGDVLSESITWGGKGIGSFVDGKKIYVSDIKILNNSILYTGFPSRFNTKNENKLADYCDFMGKFGKVRMIGSASISLVKVAKGSAEYYLENDIMLWDVAAGLAVVEGAGGVVYYKKGNFKNSLNVQASNGKINT